MKQRDHNNNYYASEPQGSAGILLLKAWRRHQVSASDVIECVRVEQLVDLFKPLMDGQLTNGIFSFNNFHIMASHELLLLCKLNLKHGNSE